MTKFKAKDKAFAFIAVATIFAVGIVTAREESPQKKAAEAASTKTADTPVEKDADGRVIPVASYISPIGSFMLNGRKGFAIYRWSHKLGDVDSHAHNIEFERFEMGKDRQFYAVYRVVTDGHDDEDLDPERIKFGTRNVAPDKGYRIWYEDHEEEHLWTTDAERRPLHVH